MKAISTINSHASTGTGRSYVILIESGSQFETEAERLQALLSDLGQISIIKIKEIGKDWRQALNDLLEFLDSEGVRSASFIAFEDATVLVQALCLRRPKLLRTIVFIDGVTRAHPSSFVKMVEKIENFLPLGLPFRSDFPGFDGKPFLQRIRCPVLVGLSAKANQYRKEQASLLVSGMPTSFLIEFEPNELEQQIRKAMDEFQQIPVKMPQKNLRAS